MADFAHSGFRNLFHSGKLPRCRRVPFSETRVHIRNSLLPLAGLHRFPPAFGEESQKIDLNVRAYPGPVEGVGACYSESRFKRLLQAYLEGV